MKLNRNDLHPSWETMWDDLWCKLGEHIAGTIQENIYDICWSRIGSPVCFQLRTNYRDTIEFGSLYELINT